MMQLVRIVPAPEGGEGVRVTVELQDGTSETWKALAVEIILDTPTGLTGVGTTDSDR